jgi:hypothetical protein
MLVDPFAKTAKCNSCGQTWNIWDSNFHCSCGNAFTAKEAESAVKAVLNDACLEVIKYWKMMEEEDRLAAFRSKRTFREFLIGVVGGVSEAAATMIFGLINRFFS